MCNLTIVIDFNISYGKGKYWGVRSPQDFYFKRMGAKRKMRRKKNKRNKKQMEQKKKDKTKTLNEE